MIGVARWAEYHQAVDGNAYPKLKALRQRIEDDPAVRFAQAIEDGETPAGAGGFLGHVPLAEVLATYRE